MKHAKFVVKEYTNPSGEIVFRVCGSLDGKRIRKNLPTRADAKAEAAALEIQRVQGETGVRPTVTRLTENELFVETNHPTAVPFFALCLFAGIRPCLRTGEILRLKPEHAKLNEGIIRIDGENAPIAKPVASKRQRRRRFRRPLRLWRLRFSRGTFAVENPPVHDNSEQLEPSIRQRMSTPIQELERWMKAPREGEHLEFKEAKNQYDVAKIYRYCVALANEGGGKLVLGVSDKLPRQVVGSAAFPNSADLASKIFIKLRFRVDVEELAHPAGRVVILHIPPRPAGTAFQFAHQGAWKRNLLPRLAQRRAYHSRGDGKTPWCVPRHSPLCCGGEKRSALGA